MAKGKPENERMRNSVAAHQNQMAVNQASFNWYRFGHPACMRESFVRSYVQY